MAAITLSDLNNNLERQNNILKMVQESSDKMSSSLVSLVDSFRKGFEGDKLEAEREGKPEVASAAAGGGFLGGLADSSFFGGLFKGLLPIIAGIGGALIASFTEFGNDLARTFASIFLIDKFKAGFDKITKLFSAEGRIAKFIDDISVRLFVIFDDARIFFSEKINKLGTLIKEGPIGRFFNMMFGDITKSFSTAIDDIKVGTVEKIAKFKSIFMGEKTLFGALGRFADSVSEFLSPIVQRVSAAFSAEGGFGKLMTNLQKAVDFVSDSPIGKALSTLGGILKKIFLPIGLIFTAYDVVKGAIAGYEEGGIGGAIGGAIKGLLASVVGAPLDLLRSGVAFILDKVGMEGAADYLKSFNVSDLIGRAIDSIPFMFKSAINGILETVANILDKSIIASGFADDVRALKFDIKKPEAPTGEGVVEKTGEKIKSSTTLPDGTTITKGVDADGFEYTETKRPTTEKPTVAGSGAGAVPAGNLKVETDEMNQRAGQSTSPVIIQDNSSRVTGGNSSQGVVMNTNPFDLYDPMARS